MNYPQQAEVKFPGGASLYMTAEAIRKYLDELKDRNDFYTSLIKAALNDGLKKLGAK